MTTAERLLLAAAHRVEPEIGENGEDSEDGGGHGWRDAAVIDAVEAAWLAGDHDGVLALAGSYDALVLQVPRRCTDETGAPGVRLVPAGTGERRRRGAFATPPVLAAALAAHALPAPSLSAPTVVDPACGAGALLRAGFARLLALGAAPADALAALHGVDADEAAVSVCRAALAALACAAGHPCEPADLASRIVVGDALLGGTRLRPGPGGLVWHEAFPAILDGDPARPGDPVTGWRGGFDAVLANPPWERLKVTGKDWAGRPPEGLKGLRADAARGVRAGGRHPLTGTGEVNAYLPFAETCWRLLAPSGRAALVVPAGIASDRSAAPLVEAWLQAGALERLHLLDPPEAIFPGVSRRVMVAVVVLCGGVTGAPASKEAPASERFARVAVGLAGPGDDPGDREWRLDPALPRLVSPNTGTLPLFTGERDAAVVAGVHRRVPVLIRRGTGGEVLANPWQLRLVTPLHMTKDACWFATAPGEGLLPLWEAKHAGLLDPAGGATARHRYWVPESLMHQRFGELTRRGWLAGYRNVTTVDSLRTLVPTPIPVAGVGNSLPLLSAPQLPLLLAALASLPVDHAVRSKHAGANLNFFKLEQAAVPPPSAYLVPAPWAPGLSIGAWVLERFARAVAWTPGLAGLAVELEAAGVPLPAWQSDPTRDPATAAASAAGRLAALADLDAVHAVLLGLDRGDLEHVLSTFTALRARELRTVGRFATADRVLEAYDALTR